MVGAQTLDLAPLFCHPKTYCSEVDSWYAPLEVRRGEYLRAELCGNAPVDGGGWVVGHIEGVRVAARDEDGGVGHQQGGVVNAVDLAVFVYLKEPAEERGGGGLES